MALPGSVPFGPEGTPLCPTTNTAQAAQAGAATIVTGAGRLFGVTVTTTGVTPLVITDGASGTSIFVMAASPPLGYNPISGGNVFNTSLVVAGSATNPAIVLHWASKGTP